MGKVALVGTLYGRVEERECGLKVFLDGSLYRIGTLLLELGFEVEAYPVIPGGGMFGILLPEVLPEGFSVKGRFGGEGECEPLFKTVPHNFSYPSVRLNVPGLLLVDGELGDKLEAKSAYTCIFGRKGGRVCVPGFADCFVGDEDSLLEQCIKVGCGGPSELAIIRKGTFFLVLSPRKRSVSLYKNTVTLFETGVLLPEDEELAVDTFISAFAYGMLLFRRDVLASAQYAVSVLETLGSGASGLSGEEAVKKVKEALFADPLTGLYTRKFLDTLGNERFDAVALFDMDNFKRINDTYGHEAGDFALKHFVKVASSSIRGSDLLVRWGGEEFLLLLKGAYSEAKRVAERIRKNLENTPFRYEGKEIRLTVSAGVAPVTTTLEDAIREADERLYRAKRSGKNRVV